MSSNGAVQSDVAREWIIQRCTQRWKGTYLQYEPWPLAADPMTRDEMLKALDRCAKHWPGDEFRGHNIRPRAAGAKPCGPVPPSFPG